jgi:nucleoside-diphosphate-sugar epimerase
MSNAYLVTGIPGFIGKRLVQKLLPEGRRIYLLCEPRFRDATEAWVAEVGGEKGQLVVAPGDITENDLALGPNLERVRHEVSDVYHLAALYDLAVSEDLARKVNVLGTGKVLKLLRGFPAGRAPRHHYVSTCYVAGAREGMIFEGELDRGQGFKNHYESTKYAAEVLVERSKRELDTRILRPAIVIGDSRTGETQKFDGPYPMFGAVMMGLLVVVPGGGRARMNLVPVDWIVDCLAALPRQADTAGKTFHLADPNPLTSRELIGLVAERLGAPRPRLDLPEAAFRPLFRNKRLQGFFGLSEQSLDYVNCQQIFDTTNTRTALRGTGLEAPPPLPSYLNQILRYFRERAKLPWRLDTPA